MYNASSVSTPQIQILAPPVVYKPTPRTELEKNSNLAPEPVKKKPKLEYVPKSKHHKRSNNIKYTPSTTTATTTTVPASASLYLPNNENNFELDNDVFNVIDEIIQSESRSSDSIAVEEGPPVYIPTRINDEPIVTKSDLIPQENGTKSKDENKLSEVNDLKPSKSSSGHDRHKISSSRSQHSHTSSREKGRDKDRKKETDKSHDKISSKKDDSTHKSSKSLSSRHNSKSSSSRTETESKSKSVHVSNDRTTQKDSSKNTQKPSSSRDLKRSSNHLKTSTSSTSDRTNKEHRSSKTTSSSSKSSSKESHHRNKTKEKKEPSPVYEAPVSPPLIPSPSSVFDTDSDEDDVMAQCRLIFDEFKTNRKENGNVIILFPNQN